jgi:hypothetical protein
MTESTGHSRRSSLDTGRAIDGKPHNQVGQLRQAPDVERRATRRHHHEGIRRHDIGPLSRQRHQLTGCVVDIDPVELPALAPLDELEFLASEGVERVGYPDSLGMTQIPGFRCIRLFDPTVRPRRSTI